MSDAFFSVERRPDGVAVVTLSRPKANALSVEVGRQLEAVFDELATDPPGAVVVWGGPRIFAAGADIAEFRGGIDHARRMAPQLRAALDKVAAFPRITIAAVAGYALGGGCELALACDLRVVADTAKLGQPEILLGLIPGGGGTQRLTRLVGVSRAKDLIFTGRQIGADEALRIGLADRVVPADGCLDAAVELAAGLARGPLVALARAKQAIDEGLDGPLGDGLDREQAMFVELFGTEDAQAGVRSFLDEGPGRATFRGR